MVSTDIARTPSRQGIFHAATLLITRFQESEENVPWFPTVIRLLAPNDIMDIQLTIASAQCFMHDILRTVQNTTLEF